MYMCSCPSDPDIRQPGRAGETSGVLSSECFDHLVQRQLSISMPALATPEMRDWRIALRVAGLTS